MISQEYTNNAEQQRLNMEFSFFKSLLHKKLQTSITARQEVMRNYKIPPVFACNASYIFNNYWKLNTVVNTMYRLPTFNDLYWLGAGNPNLKSEEGIGAELGIHYTASKYGYKKSITAEVDSKTKKLIKNTTTAGLTVFNRNVSNWIQWIPDATNIWRPSNLLQVWSRGVEASAKQNWNFSNWQIELNALYTFVNSTVEKVANGNTDILGKQLIYTPMHNGNAGLQIGYKTWQAVWQQQFTGIRFTTSDNAMQLPVYYVSNIQIRKSLPYNNNVCNVTAGINNLTNNNYQVIAYRPMPLRNYFASLQMRLNTLKF
jgi:vitamin B12 transporter